LDALPLRATGATEHLVTLGADVDRVYDEFTGDNPSA